MSNIRRYCPICQFEDTFSINELNQIKKNLNKIQTYYYDILGHICEIKKIDGTDDFWEKKVRYSRYCTLKEHVDYL